MAENTGKKGNNTWLIVGVLALAGIGFYFWWKSRKTGSITINYNDINASQYPNLTESDIQGALDMANSLVETMGVENAISELRSKAQDILNNPNATAKDKELAKLFNDIANQLETKKNDQLKSGVSLNSSEFNGSAYPEISSGELKSFINDANNSIQTNGVDNAIGKLKDDAKKLLTDTSGDKKKNSAIASLFNDVILNLEDKKKNVLGGKTAKLSIADINPSNYPALKMGEIKKEIDLLNAKINKGGFQGALDKVNSDIDALTAEINSPNFANLSQKEKDAKIQKLQLLNDLKNAIQEKITLQGKKDKKEIKAMMMVSQTMQGISDAQAPIIDMQSDNTTIQSSATPVVDPFFIDKAQYVDNSDTLYDGLSQDYIDSNIDRINNLVKNIGVEATIAQLTAEYIAEPDKKKAEFLKEITAFLDIQNGANPKKYNYPTSQWHKDKLKNVFRSRGLAGLVHYLNVALRRGQLKMVSDGFGDAIIRKTGNGVSRAINSYLINLKTANPNIPETTLYDNWIDQNIDINLNVVGKPIGGQMFTKSGKYIYYDGTAKSFQYLQTPVQMAQMMVDNQIKSMSLGGIDMTSQKTKNAMMQQAMMQVKR